MADVAITAAGRRDELIAAIADILDELKQLGARLSAAAELGKIKTFSGAQLLDELDCRREQLTRRKKFLGVK